MDPPPNPNASSLRNLEFSTQFTEDVITNSPHPCDRCLVVIQPGQNRHYIASSTMSNKAGKFVCDACLLHYSQKKATLVKSRTGITPSLTAAQQNQTPLHPSVQDIRGMINVSQRQGSHTAEGRVTALPHNISIGRNMAPPSPQALQMYYSSQPSGQNVVGYSPVHLQYASERERWSTAAYKGPPARLSGSGQIPLAAQAHQEVRILMIICHQLSGTKEHRTDLKEGMPVDYDILPGQLSDFVKSILTPHLTSLCPGFPWDLSSMVVQESKTWQDVMKMPLSIPYFNGCYLKAKPGTKREAGEVVFSPPPSPVEFVLVIDQIQWLRSEHFLEQQSQQRRQIHRPSTPDSTYVLSNKSAKHKVPPSPEKAEKARSASRPSGLPTLTVSESSYSLPDKEVPQSLQTTSSERKIEAPFLGYAGRHPKAVNSTKEKSTQASVSNPTTSNLIQSDQNVPFEKFIGSGNYAQLDSSQIKKGIFVGGHNAIRRQEKLLDAQTIHRVKCYIIKDIAFDELCIKETQLISPETYFGVLAYDPKAEYIGTGAFKTAQKMVLTWATSQPPNFTFGSPSILREYAVAAKRPHNGTVSALCGKAIKLKYKRFNYADERNKAYLEGTSLGFASSLLNYSYQFIDHFIAQNKDKLPTPFIIPRLRFVKGAIALSETTPTKGSSQADLHFAYLLEELLPEEPFIKYVHNGTAEPLQDPGQPGYDLGVFLCFIQHVQYVQTHGQTYTSDFQGAGILLTDPQIMTKLSLIIVPGTGILKDDLFGDGNVNTAFDSFTQEHKCNKFCKWFELSVLEDKGNQDIQPTKVTSVA